MMNIVGIRLKRYEKFGWYQASQRRYAISLCCQNMTKEQADKLESGIRKVCLAVLPAKDPDENLFKEMKEK